MQPPIRSHNTPTRLKTFLYGSPYYPEHWDEVTRAGDPELFKAAGWNVIRMAEFAWDQMEPELGRYDFSLFDETIERFGALDIKTILCTPTATPPRWLTRAHPEVLRADANGRVMCHGSRQHASHFSPIFREHSRRITQVMAEHFAKNPHVIGWQTDNEFHCHFAEDFSPAAEQAFREFLSKKHGSIDALNQAWGSVFWAQSYRDFNEVDLPRPNRPTHLNPAHQLDYQRFLSDGVTRFQAEQVVRLRAANSDWWITHNGVFHLIDYAGDFGADLDFLGYDSYPYFDTDPRTRPYSHAFNMDYARSFSGNMVILEQQSGPGGQSGYLHDNPEPGEMRRMAWINIARGSDGLLFFRERSCRFGAEEYWCGILDHDNVPRRRYAEAAQLGGELARIGPHLLGTAVEIEIGIASADFDAQNGHEPISHGLPNPKQVAEGIHRYFNQQSLAVGCVHPGGELASLKLLCIPHFAVLDPTYTAHWQSWVTNGGVLLIGARSGSRDLNSNVIAETLPGCLRSLVGATVEEYGRQNRPDLRPLPIQFSGAAGPVATDLWYEQLAPDSETEVVATWAARHLEGSPAITLRRHGRGAVLYVGTYLTDPILQALQPLLLELGAIHTPTAHVTGVEQVVRAGAGRRLRFFINHNPDAVKVPISTGGSELISQTEVTDTLELASNAVAIVAEADQA